MKFSRAGRWTFAVLVLLTVWVHGSMIGAGGVINVGAGNVSSLLLTAAHPKIIFSIGSQIAVILAAYALLFGVVVLLSRQRRQPRHRAETDACLLLFAWMALSWLVMRLHSQYFPYSVWTWLMSYVQRPTASWALDLASIAFLLWRISEIWLLRRPRSGRGGVLVWGAAAIAIAFGMLVGLHLVRSQSSPSNTASSAPNVVIIGLDSVRRDVLLSANADRMPNLAALRDASFVNVNVVTPLARTFPAWVSILTGLGPDASGARENLVPQTGIRRDASVAWDFHRAGYRTAYATDETRFSYIVPEFGFDEVIGPQMGAADFVLAQFGDMPLANFLVQLPYAEYLLPALVGNRGFAHAYRPEHFVARLSRALGPAGGRPTFLAVHLCTAHWPYFVARARSLDSSLEEPDRSYQAMLAELDDQLGTLLQSLKAAGYLNTNTLVAVLADHGEGLSKDRAGAAVQVTLPDGSRGEVQGFQGGHGATLLAPAQWEVFTLFSGVSVRGPIAPGTSHRLASLEDVAGTLKRLSGLQHSEASSVASQDEERPVAEMGSTPYARIETGWRPKGLDLTRPDGSEVLRLAMTSHRVLPNGQIELKSDALTNITADKDYGVTDGLNSLAVVAVGSNRVVAMRGPGQDRWSGVLVADTHRADANGPLLAAACAWPDMRALMAGWCPANDP